MTRRLAGLMFSIASLVLITLPALAQAPPAGQLHVPYGVSINAERAKRVAAASIAEARKNNWTMAIAIVDTGGHLVYFEKMQDTQLGSVDVSIDKARSAVLFRRPTKVFQDGVAAGGEGLRMLRLTGAIPIDGGVPLIVEGKVVGALGVSGGTSQQDGEVAIVGAGAAE